MGDCNWEKINTAITLPTEIPSDNGHNRKHYTTIQHNKYITAHNGVCFAYRWTGNLIHFIVRQSSPPTSLARQYDNDCINVIAPAALKPAVRNYIDLYVPTGLILSLFLSCRRTHHSVTQCASTDNHRQLAAASCAPEKKSIEENRSCTKGR